MATTGKWTREEVHVTVERLRSTLAPEDMPGLRGCGSKVSQSIIDDQQVLDWQCYSHCRRCAVGMAELAAEQ